ncbi:MAG: hypothetical protein ACT4PL_03325 [Phycisphaerales bacterium]
MYSRKPRPPSPPVATPALLALAIALAAALPAHAQTGTHVQESFEEEILGNWSLPRRAIAPRGQNFLGTYANETNSLFVGDLPEHSHIVIAVDLYIIGPWRGSGTAEDLLAGFTPCNWSLRVDDGREIVNSTFSNDTTPFGAEQTYPRSTSERPGRAMAGAFKIGSLGYPLTRDDRPQEAVYRLLYTLKHSGGSVRLDFTGSGLTDGQVWGLDNLVVETYVQDDTALGELGSTTLPGADAFGETGGSPGSSSAHTNPGATGGPPGGAPSGNPRPTQPSPTVTPTPGTFALMALGIAAANRRKRR